MLSLLSPLSTFSHIELFGIMPECENVFLVEPKMFVFCLSFFFFLLVFFFFWFVIFVSGFFMPLFVRFVSVQDKNEYTQQTATKRIKTKKIYRKVEGKNWRIGNFLLCTYIRLMAIIFCCVFVFIGGSALLWPSNHLCTTQMNHIPFMWFK